MFDVILNVPQLFYSRTFYSDLVLNKKSKGFEFIFLLFFVGLAIAVLGAGPTFQKAHAAIPGFFDSLPGFTIKDGILSIDKPSPYIVKFPSQEFSVVVDTAYQEKDASLVQKKMSNEKIVTLFMADRVVTMKSGDRIDMTTYPLKFNNNGHDTNSVTMTHDDLISFGQVVSRVFYPVTFAMTCLIVFLVILIKAFLGAMVLTIISPLFGIALTLGGCLRLSAAASVPIGIVASLQPLPIFVKLGVWAMYCLFGLWAARKTIHPEKL